MPQQHVLLLSCLWLRMRLGRRASAFAAALHALRNGPGARCTGGAAAGSAAPAFLQPATALALLPFQQRTALQSCRGC